jgi:hypothetical protein
MELLPPPCAIRTEWKTLYRTAIRERDRTVAWQAIVEAEKAILARERELFYGPGTLEEKVALEEALQTLGALKSAWTHSNRM